MSFFKPEDFSKYASTEKTIPYGFCKAMTELCNAKLEKEGEVAYGCNYDNEKGWAFNIEKKFPETTHKALLINIEPISKCEHPLNKCRVVIKSDDVVRRYPSKGGYQVFDKFQFLCECGELLNSPKYLKG